MRILLVDRDETLMEALKQSLTECNYVVDAVNSSEQGWTYGSTYTYDLIVLDLGWPSSDSIGLCRRFRDNGYQTPILLLSSRNTTADKIQGLDAGADDYVIKPFDFEELTARIRALLRRGNGNLLPILTWGDLQLNLCSREVTYQGQLLCLTAKEYGLLELFLCHDRTVLETHEIIDSLWPSEESPAEATVRSHLKVLRQKLHKAGAPKDLIETVRGQGYRLKAFPENEEVSFSSQGSQGEELSGTIWAKCLQKRKEQLKILQEAAEAIAANHLESFQQERARLAARDLAENLSLFDLTEAAKLARQLEELLSGEDEENQSNGRGDREIYDSAWIGQNVNTVTLVKSAPPIAAILQELQQKLTELPRDNSIVAEPQILGDRASLLLLVDDDISFTDAVTTAAKMRGIGVEIVPKPREMGLRLQSQGSRSPDIVLLKLSFLAPHAILAERLAAIAELNLRSPSLPLLIMADRDGFAERLEVARRGSCFFLQASATPEQAIVSVEEILMRSRRQYNITIVDDDVEFLRSVPSLLHPWRFNITTLDDPRQFWDILQAIPPDLLVLNIEMPYISGIELCQVLRSHPYWQHLPILFLTAHTDFATQNRVFAIGADDFVSKPILGQDLATRILNRLQRNTHSQFAIGE